MLPYLLPIAFAVFVWWFSTGLVFMADGRTSRSQSRILWAVTVLLAVCLVGVWATRDMATVSGAYLAFGCGLGVWAWMEVSFLLGLVTGPVNYPCPKDAGPWQRFKLASGTVLYHELAILLGGLVLLALVSGAANQVAFWTYAVLAGMRLSAKLNVFFGVANLAAELLPPRLAYLKSYFGTRNITAFFGLSVTAGTVLTAFIFHAAHGDPHQIAGAMLVGSLMALALLEHWLLILPIRDSALWDWATGAKRAEAETGGPAAPAQTAITETGPKRTGPTIARVGG